MRLGRNGQLAAESSSAGEAMAEPYSHVGLWTLHDGEAEEGVGWVGGLVGLSSSTSVISGLMKEKRIQSSFGSSGILLPPNGAVARKTWEN